MSTGSWQRISEGDPEKTVLAVDFDSTARPEAGFRRFAPLLPPGRDLWLTSQPDAAETEVLDAEAYLGWWRELPGSAHGHVEAVLGYCVGGVFAAALADHIERQQGSRPALLLFDPEPVDSLSLYRDFKKAVDAMSLLSEEERGSRIAEALTVCEMTRDDFRSGALAIVKLYEGAAGLAFDRLGLDEDGRGPDGDVPLLRVLPERRPSAGPRGGLGQGPRADLGDVQSGRPAGAAGAELPLGTGELLNNQDVADAVHGILKERSA